MRAFSSLLPGHRPVKCSRVPSFALGQYFPLVTGGQQPHSLQGLLALGTCQSFQEDSAVSWGEAGQGQEGTLVFLPDQVCVTAFCIVFSV